MFWLNIIWIGILVYIAVRIWPAVKEHYQNGPKGSTKQWLNVAMLLGGMILFVLLLISMVRN